MKKIGFLATVLVVVASCASITKGKVDQGKEVGKIESQWANLKVLPQDISEEELKGLMREYNAALGVKCNHCHAPNAEGKMDFASDANPKKDIARHMIVMNDDLNKKHFDYDASDKKKVSCFTCHQGSVMPKKVSVPQFKDPVIKAPLQNFEK